MKVTLCTILFIIASFSKLYAQLVIGSNNVKTAPGTSISTNTDILINSTLRSFGESAWHLVGADQQITTATGITTFYQLYVNGGGSKILNGNYSITNQLHFIEGVLVVSSSGLGSLILGSPSVVQDGHSSSSYVDGMLQINIGDNNRATYPLGNNGIYAPVQLANISGDSPIIGVDANQQSIEDIGKTIVLPDQVSDFSNNWFWQLALFSDQSTFGQANISIPLTAQDKTQFTNEEDYKPVVLYHNLDGVTMNLDNASGDGASGDDATITSRELGREGHYFAGKTLVFTPIVHNIITPNGDNVNDQLVIENLEFFPTNEVVLVDRYGMEVYSTKDYVSPDPSGSSTQGEDFTFLSPGNYICILKYNDGKNTIKQTISVIK